jgi:hypothetical protein
MPAERELAPFVAWPREEWRRLLPLCGAFAVLFSGCYAAASWLAARHASLPQWDIPFDRFVPFVPSMSLVYLTITPVLMLAPFVFRTRAQLWRFAAVLCIETVIASLFFVLMPQTTGFVRPIVTGWIRFPFGLADAMNLEYNQFPSLHVAFAVTAALAYSRSAGKAVRGLLPLWSVGVVASTWLMWEHNLADITGGIVLAALAMRFVEPWLQRPETGEAAWVEWCCLVQCLTFSRRHRRYFVIFATIYLGSLLHWRRYRGVRTGYCLAQWIDDLLDGDRPCDGEPLVITEQLIAEMTARSFSRRDLSRLTAAFFAELTSRPAPDGRDPRQELIALVRNMQRDRERVLCGAVWEQRQLDEHHHETFSLSLDLMLFAAGSDVRGADVPALVKALSWCSTFRDLEDDLRKGLINVPREAWPADRGLTTGVKVVDLARSPLYRQWVEKERERALLSLEQCELELMSLSDIRARRILETFRSSVARYARRHRPLAAYRRCHPELPERSGGQ